MSINTNKEIGYRTLFSKMYKIGFLLFKNLSRCYREIKRRVFMQSIDITKSFSFKKIFSPKFRIFIEFQENDKYLEGVKQIDQYQPIGEILRKACPTE